MIGAGDGTKSTLLKAIEWILWPTWNLYATDNDFYNSHTSDNVILQGTFTELPKELLSEEKYGLYLRRYGIPLEDGVDDEPIDSEPVCLTIRLTIDSSLAPVWEVVCNRKDPKPISHKERQLLVVGCVGTNCDRDMLWSRYSVLQKYANSKEVLHESYIDTLREVSNNAEFCQLDGVSKTISSIGRKYGVELSTEVKSKLIMQNSTLSSSVGLFEGGAPLSQRGLGSQRLLSMGLNIEATSDGAILLIDEIETGLEPYRLKSLINEFRTNHSTSGQIIMTTHSATVVAECTTHELLIIKSSSGITSAYPLQNPNQDVDGVIQGQVRRNPEAFLCRRIIVCEGKTEIGFVRAMDNFISNKLQYRMAYRGVGVADGGGDQVFACAKFLSEGGYDVCIFMDSDISEKEITKEDIKRNIDIYDWDIGNSIEEQVFFDVSQHLAELLLHIAVDEKGLDSIAAKLSNIPYELKEGVIRLKFITPEHQRRIGSMAKDKGSNWYKRIDLGEKMGDIVFDNWDHIGSTTTLHSTIKGLIDWVNR